MVSWKAERVVQGERLEALYPLDLDFLEQDSDVPSVEGKSIGCRALAQRHLRYLRVPGDDVADTGLVILLLFLCDACHENVGRCGCR